MNRARARRELAAAHPSGPLCPNTRQRRALSLETSGASEGLRRGGAPRRRRPAAFRPSCHASLILAPPRPLFCRRPPHRLRATPPPPPPTRAPARFVSRPSPPPLRTSSAAASPLSPPPPPWLTLPPWRTPGRDPAQRAEAADLRHHQRARGDRPDREEVEEQHSVEGDGPERCDRLMKPGASTRERRRFTGASCEQDPRTWRTSSRRCATRRAINPKSPPPHTMPPLLIAPGAAAGADVHQPGAVARPVHRADAGGRETCETPPPPHPPPHARASLSHPHGPPPLSCDLLPALHRNGTAMASTVPACGASVTRPTCVCHAPRP